MVFLYISKRYSKVNNKYLSSYYHKKPTHNLHGHAIWKSLPTGGFNWLDPARFDLDKYDDNSASVYVISWSWIS